MDNKLWIIISGTDDDEIAAYAQKGNATFDEIFSRIRIVVAERVQLQISSGQSTKIFYEGEELEPPKVFWPAITNCDSFPLENILLSMGSKNFIKISEAACARSKLLTYQRLAQNGIRIPETIAFFCESDKKKVIEKLGYPFVVKPDNGYGGAGVELIHNEEEFDAWFEKTVYGVTYVAQEFISTSKGKDIRVGIMNGEYVYSYIRKSADENEFRSNIHVGGSKEEFTIDENTKALCEKIAALYDLPLLGVDLMIGDGEYVVAEVNAFPGLSNKEYLMKAYQLIMRKLL